MDTHLNHRSRGKIYLLAFLSAFSLIPAALVALLLHWGFSLWTCALLMLPVGAAAYFSSGIIYSTLTQRWDREKSRFKRELTNNVNHELKTPVSAIKAYLETMVTLQDMDAGTMRDFASKAYSQTSRLEKLLKDVSLITRLDEAGSMFAREPVDISETISDIRAYLSALPQDRSMRLYSNIPQMTFVTGDPTLINSIFYNLVDNSLAYSGGSEIYITLLSMDRDMIEISYADNGAGVKEEHLEMLFQRFYRVDKGRSRKAGGTGLGLSIVKNAVLYHNGTIYARTRKGGGLEFVFTLHR